MKDFKNKVAVITGAASGIGRALAEAFASEQSRIVLADIAQEPLRVEEQRLRNLGAEVIAVSTDVADSKSVEALAKATLDHFGAVHILCNNAGIGQDMRPIWDFPLDYWHSFFSIDFWSVVHGVRTFVPHMLRQDDECHIVNTASLAGVVPYPVPYHGPYSSAKAAVIAFTESLSADLRRANSKVKASVLCPALVKTNILNSDLRRSLGLPAVEVTEKEISAKWNTGLEGAMEPNEFATRVLAGIREERLYIMTNSEYDDLVRSRTEDMLLNRNPTVLLL